MYKKSKSFISLLLVAVLTLASITTPALAYKSLGFKITSTITFVPYNGFTSTSIAHMGEAVRKWNTAAGSTLMKISSSTHSVTTGYPNTYDRNNYIYRIDVGPGYVGECCYVYSADGVLRQADININVYYPFANSAQPNCYDLYSVFIHEAGHAAGLDDNDSLNTTSVMYVCGPGVAKRDLAVDDIIGIRAIYR